MLAVFARPFAAQHSTRGPWIGSTIHDTCIDKSLEKSCHKILVISSLSSGVDTADCCH